MQSVSSNNTIMTCNGALKGLGGVAVWKKPASVPVYHYSFPFITTKVPKAIHSSQIEQRKVALEKVGISCFNTDIQSTEISPSRVKVQV